MGAIPFTKPRRAAVLTVSDSSFQGTRDDLSGPAICELLKQNDFQVVAQEIVADEQAEIAAHLIQFTELADLIVTTGGTGLGPRDVTPEATMQVCEKLVPGLAELMRAQGLKETPFAPLSRSVCGSLRKTLIVNLPGNPKGAVGSLKAVLHLLPHALDLLRGNTAHHDQGHV